MKYYLIAGEASGDLHASNLMKSLKNRDAQAEFRFFGGDRMIAVGGECVKHHRDISFMGFQEVAANIRTILSLLAWAKKDIAAYRPDAIILVDYPGFNLRMAKFCHAMGLKVFYYISPQVWAWKKNRVFKIKKYVDQMFVILPFEKDFYAKYDYEVQYVGHPLLDALPQIELKPKDQFRSENHLDDRPIIALLPGSRLQELHRILPKMLKGLSAFSDFQIVIAGMNSLGLSVYEEWTKNQRVSVVLDQTYDLLNNASVAVVASGTATLETALFNVPQVVCYETTWTTYQIAKYLVNIKFISLVNLIYGSEMIVELIQHDINPGSLEREIKKLLDPEIKRNLLARYIELKEILGGGGASEKTANGIWNSLKEHA